MDTVFENYQRLSHLYFKMSLNFGAKMTKIASVVYHVDFGMIDETF